MTSHDKDISLLSYLDTSTGHRGRVGLYLHVDRVGNLQRKAQSGIVVSSLCANMESDNLRKGIEFIKSNPSRETIRNVRKTLQRIFRMI